MNRLLLIVAWALLIGALVLVAMLGWRRVHPPRSEDQRILLEKAK